MKLVYRFIELPENETSFYEMILLEELDLQSWYSVFYCSLLGGEVFITTH